MAKSLLTFLPEKSMNARTSLVGSPLALLSRKILAGSANLSDAPRTFSEQALRQGLALTIPRTPVAVPRCCARGRAHSGRLRLCGAGLFSSGARLSSLFVGAVLICAGASLVGEAVEEDQTNHWSFQPIMRPKISSASATQSTTRNPIDAFVSARLAEHGLKPAPEADRRLLIRRLCFDLIGTPPTPEEVTAFIRDPRADAYEQLVDRLLASPHFGERWARHWLDVVRFAETHGFEMNQPMP